MSNLKSGSYDHIILGHYKKVAKNNGLDGRSSIEDQYIRKSELECLSAEIEILQKIHKKELTVLDVGCGNGHTLATVSQRFPGCMFYGLEFSPDLFQLATSRKIPNVEIIHHDCRQEIPFNVNFDLIYTERVIINILNRKDQYIAVDNISKRLSPQGRYLAMESFRESLVELNLARREMCLEDVSPSKHNLFLSEHFANKLERFGLHRIPTAMPFNHMSTHFYVTRVFHKAIRPEGGKVKFSRMAQFFTEALPPAIGNYSPIQFHLFEKR
ncbi:MAG: hypothetical protein A2504_16025 [Bdellovibrionales bacterium RIFOXYD12_FULL_39_22]|nr:MAG: hypothetical protein A2385_07935 [Bdellovibrionales bacterium RIFOXYB1_FULL_39_21]OFZ43011.1 MAG: hypothetical protein A2485_11290 [Bdellovibrionales bacterium RIFOXYC12_FULL_39_17]OFZ50903.1 MAG: hypothetical protein A2404_06850 [Bdellovibrionales bacterium RIFOXYC1_FULL_39_130]OFZ73638.1 MAG: hypothetical protein A2451_06385 [Bdellovibrionales bacterium RIFOXYC2_FULL_39_8]OFZ78126.1 MAG: hypothetical protein A2560_02020 [Bdellovibrionales bacterium RIFOXYD1_FULL_39_84]OFZ93994.1 MAG: